MKRSEDRSKSVAVLATAVVLVSLSTSGCGNKPEDKSAATVSTQAGTATSTSTSSSASSAENTSKATGTADTTSASGDKKGATKSGASTNALTGKGKLVGAAGTASDTEELPQIVAAQKKIDLGKMPDMLTICSVADVPITMGDYRRQRRLETDEVRSELSVNATMLQDLLAVARAHHLSIPDAEKVKLIAMAHKTKEVTGGVLQKYLQDQHLTQEQFDQHVLDIGLAMKAAEFNIDSSLLSELVDRELLCSAARANGFGPDAFNRYSELKKSPQYQYLVKSGLMSADQMKEETIKSELMALELQKIRESAQVTDQQINDYYTKNKSKFKHGERIRLSQIVVAAPKEDGPGGESVRTQIKKKNPNMTPAQLDAETKVTEQQLNKRAQDILARALKGEDFAQLANQYTDDIPVRAAKLGGDMGYQEKDHLLKDFSDKIWPLKSGQVYPDVIPSELGYHIFKVTDKQGPGVLPLAEVKDVLKQALAQNNQAAALSNWIAERRKSVAITLSPEFQQIVSATTKGDKTATQ